MNKKPVILLVLDILSLVFLAVAAYLALSYAPMEATMGNVQKVFYFHVANAWVGMLGFISAGVAGIAYLRSGNPKWDIVEVAAVEISLGFFLIAILLARRRQQSALVDHASTKKATASTTSPTGR